MNMSNPLQCQNTNRTRITLSMCLPGEGLSNTLVVDSEWEIDGYHWRLTECPAGYTFRRDALTPEGDQCSPCLPGTYLAQPTNDSRVKCLPCPVGATCPGLDQVDPVSGYWSMPLTEGGRRAASGSGSLGKRVFKCPIGACNGSVCLNNRVGPVCGLCPLNFALSTAGCIQCPAAEPLAAYRAAAAVIGSILLFLLWVCISWGAGALAAWASTAWSPWKGRLGSMNLWDHLLPATVRKAFFYHMKNLGKYKKNADNLQT